MVCIYCSGRLRVVNSRPQKRNNQIWRRRQCQTCLAVFTSHEVIDTNAALMVQRRGLAAESFVADKLFTELLLALQSRRNCYEDAREVTTATVRELLKLPSSPVFKPADISRVTAGILKRLDKQAYLRYQAEHPSLLK